MDPASKRALSPRLSAALFALGLGLAATEVHAQPAGQDPLAVAQALHEQAVKALDAKDYAAACPKFEEVVRLVPNGLGARLSLAECYEGAGRLASAYATYVALEEAAAKDPKQRERQTIAQTRSQALEPKLARLTIVVPDAVRALPGLEIQRDGAVVASSQWGVPLPVDKGSHVLTASATGKQPLEKAVNVQSDGAKASVTFDKLDDIASAPAGAPPSVDEPPPVGSPPPDEGSTFFSTQRTLALVAGGVGLVGVVVGSVFGVIAINKKSENDELLMTCESGASEAAIDCRNTAYGIREDGVTAGNVSTAMFIVGGLAVAGGVTLFVMAPSPGATTAKVAVGPGGITLRAAW